MKKEKMLQLVNDLYCIGDGTNYNIVLKNESDDTQSECFRKIYLQEIDEYSTTDSFYLSPELINVLSKHEANAIVKKEKGKYLLLIE